MKKRLKRVKRWLPVGALALLAGWLLLMGVANGTTLFDRLRTTQPVSPRATMPVMSEYTREELLAETNKRRAEKGVNPLSLDPVLNDTAQRKCEDMAARNDFNHGELQTLANELQRRVSENLTYGPAPTAEIVVQNWVNSPPHYAALISMEWTRTGFGICPFREGKLVVQHFSDEPRVQGQQTSNQARNVDLNPYKYSVSQNAGGAMETPAVEIPDWESPTYQYDYTTPSVNWQSRYDNCSAAVLYCD